MSREKQIADFENDLRECHTEFSVSDDSMDLYTDYKITAQNMIGKGWRKQSDLTPCDVCRFNPPSSGDGKPCCMCPAQAKMKGGE